jgi:hypothetical protein
LGSIPVDDEEDEDILPSDSGLDKMSALLEMLSFMGKTRGIVPQHIPAVLQRMYRTHGEEGANYIAERLREACPAYRGVVTIGLRRALGSRADSPDNPERQG